MLLKDFPLKSGFFFLSHSQQACAQEKQSPMKGEGIGTFVINLAQSTQRWSHISSLLSHLPFPLKRIEAVDGRILSLEEDFIDPWVYRRSFAQSMGYGTAGCFLSHIQAWTSFLESPYALGLICEDDIECDTTLLKTFILYLSEKEGWDICGFHLNHWGGPLTLHQQYGHRIVTYLAPVTGAGCYLLTRQAAHLLLSKALPLKLPVDHYYTRTWEFPLRLIGIEPRLVRHKEGSSVIESITRQRPYPLSLPQCFQRYLWVAVRSLMTAFDGAKQYWKNKKFWKDVVAKV